MFDRMQALKTGVRCLFCLMALFSVTIAYGQNVPEPQEIFFSTEEDFVTRGPTPADGNPIISDGDLLSSRGVVYMRNSELIQVFQYPYDLGLDAVDVIDPVERIVAFSTELDHPEKLFTQGDLLFSHNGAIVPNNALLHEFQLPVAINLGLDAVHLVGIEESILKFSAELAERGPSGLRENPQLLIEMLRNYEMDILFSLEGTIAMRDGRRILDGDLLSAQTGTVVLSNGDALPAMVPAGIPVRGVDFGFDAVTLLADVDGENQFLFSTLINGKVASFTDGDILINGVGFYQANINLIFPFEPMASDLGLDALSIITERNEIRQWMTHE